MRCHSRRVNSALFQAPMLATMLRPIPLVVMGMVGAMWITVCVTWLTYKLFELNLVPAVPPFIILTKGIILQAGYWLHGILAALLLTDRYLARDDPPGPRWTRRAVWCIAMYAVLASSWNLTVGHRYVEAAVIEWHRHPAEMYRGVTRMREAIREGTGSGEAFGHLHQAARLRPTDPEVRTWLAWFLVSHPDPTWRDPARARQLAARVTDLVRNQFDWFGNYEAERRHHDSLAALAALDGDRETALKHLGWVCGALYWEDGIDEESMPLRDLEQRVMDPWNWESPEEIRRARLILEGRPWEVWQ